MPATALITDIQHFSLHDGPGIRTTIFFKGCPLQCRWCHNPENISGTKDLMFYDNLCTLCGKCAEACPEACIMINNDELAISRGRCTLCGLCENVCNTGAIELKGKILSIDDIVDECLLDKRYYKQYGGVTLSGGEPLLKGNNVFILMDSLKQNDIHIVLDTCGSVDEALVKRSLQYIDLYYYDIKCIDRTKHRNWTGADNKVILTNLRRLLFADADITVRIPVIPGFNDSIAEITQIKDFLLEIEYRQTVHLLPYHRLGRHKYKNLDREYTLEARNIPTTTPLEPLADIFTEAGITCAIFSNT